MTGFYYLKIWYNLIVKKYDMNNERGIIMIWEIIIISVVGTLLHFTYDWSKHNKVVALFSAVNESTWEHIKMSLSAIFLCSIVDSLFLGSNPNYFFAKLVSILIIIIVIPLIFYGYKFITKKPILIIDILSFYIAIIISQLAFYHILTTNPLPFIYSYLGTVGTFIVFGLYMVLTLLPLENFIFKDPITSKYGLKGHSEEIVNKNRKR